MEKNILIGILSTIITLIIIVVSYALYYYLFMVLNGEEYVRGFIEKVRNAFKDDEDNGF